MSRISRNRLQEDQSEDDDESVGGQWWSAAESKAWYVSELQMGGGDQGDTYMTPGMLQNHATRAFSAYQALGGPDMATRVVDIALGWVHNIDQSWLDKYRVEALKTLNIAFK